MNADSSNDVLLIEWPWEMLPLECADGWTDGLRRRIGPGHPLHGKIVFSSSRFDDPESYDDVVLFEVEDDGTYAIVYFDEPVRMRGRKMPRTEIVGGFEEMKKRIQTDREVALRRIKEREEAMTSPEKTA